MPWTHIDNRKEFWTIDNTKEFSTYNTNLTFNNLAKGQPHADWENKIQAPHETNEAMLTHKQSLFALWRTESCCSWVSKKAWTTCNTRHLYYRSIIRRIKKQAYIVLVGIARLDLDASCNENGPNLFSDPTPCFLILIIVKCSKLVTMEAQTFLDLGASSCFMDKELVWQYNLALVEKKYQCRLRSLMVRAFH